MLSCTKLPGEIEGKKKKQKERKRREEEKKGREVRKERKKGGKEGRNLKFSAVLGTTSANSSIFILP